MKFKPLTYVFVIFLLNGCAPSLSTVKKQELLVVKKQELLALGYGHDYVDGYDDGCRSGKGIVESRKIGYNAEFAERDQGRYQYNVEYRNGWTKGYYECRQQAIDVMQIKNKQEVIEDDPESEKEKIWNDLKK